MTSVAERRLRAQRLVGRRFMSAVEAVSAFAAVQAQDFPAALWAVGQRTRGATAASLGRQFDDGAILRTHILRPTWHFVLPDDVGWMLALTAPRLRKRLATRWRQLDLDEPTIARAQEAFSLAIGRDGARTRPELAEALDALGIERAGQRMAHLLLAAEIDGVLISGSRRGKSFTWTRLEDRAPSSPPLERDTALARLATRYYTSHGPATLADLVWWSGLSTADARNAVSAAGRALARETIDDVDVWSAAATTDAPFERPVAHLLPNFDEYTVAYRDRSAVLAAARPFDASIFSFGSVLANVVLVDGLVRGAWRRTLRANEVKLEVTLLDRFSRAESEALDRAVAEFGRFLGRDVDVAAKVRPGS